MANEPMTGAELDGAMRFLATLKYLDPPNFVDMIRAILVLRDSQDVEAVRLAAKALLRNQQRLEDLLDDAKSEIEKHEEKKSL